MTQALTTGAHHIGLAVPDIVATRDFFCDGLGFRQVGAVPDYPAFFVSDGTTLLTLWQLTDPATANGFDRKRNAGLHHLAFGVADAEMLDLVAGKVRSWPGAALECEPCAMGAESAVRHFLCTVPGGIRVEFATPFA